MKKLLLVAAAAAALLATPALAEDMMTSTPELALPEPDGANTMLPHSTMTTSEALALPETETEPIAPFQRCSDRETVYLTN